jgi:integrase
MSTEGRIYARGSCPLCGGPFQLIHDSLICPVHLTGPKRVYIQVRRRNIFSDPKGHPFYSYEQAKRYLDRMRTEIDERTFDLSRYVAQKLKPLRFSNWCEAWLKKKRIEVEKGLRTPSYLKALKVYVGKYKHFFGETDIREIRTKEIYEFYLALSGAPHYIRNILMALEKLFHDALDWEDIAQMPKFPRIEIPEPEIKTIDLDDQDRIVNAIPNPMDRAFILFTAREMVRPSETRALQWDDVDLKHDRITIRRHYSLNKIRPATKAKQIKILPLDGEVRKTLQALPRHISSPFVFWKGKKGKSFSESWARKLWKRISSSLGVNISLYQGTRHSSATEAVNRVGVDAIQEFLHHTNRAMTKRYAKVNPDSMKKVLRGEK